MGRPVADAGAGAGAGAGVGVGVGASGSETRFPMGTSEVPVLL